jgi:hypothetical protein
VVMPVRLDIPDPEKATVMKVPEVNVPLFVKLPVMYIVCDDPSLANASPELMVSDAILLVFAFSVTLVLMMTTSPFAGTPLGDQVLLLFQLSLRTEVFVAENIDDIPTVYNIPMKMMTVRFMAGS